MISKQGSSSTFFFLFKSDRSSARNKGIWILTLSMPGTSLDEVWNVFHIKITSAFIYALAVRQFLSSKHNSVLGFHQSDIDTLIRQSYQLAFALRKRVDIEFVTVSNIMDLLLEKNKREKYRNFRACYVTARFRYRRLFWMAIEYFVASNEIAEKHAPRFSFA